MAHDYYQLFIGTLPNERRHLVDAILQVDDISNETRLGYLADHLDRKELRICKKLIEIEQVMGSDEIDDENEENIFREMEETLRARDETIADLRRELADNLERTTELLEQNQNLQREQARDRETASAVRRAGFLICITISILAAVYFALPNMQCNEVPVNTTVATIPKEKCDDGWKYFDQTDFCYFIGVEHTLNQVAQTRCKSQGAHLASIHSAAENSFIQDYAYSSGKEPPNSWIGLYRTGPEKRDFVNYDETPVDYTNWNYANPDYTSGIEYCTEMLFSYPNVLDGQWNDYPCFHTLPLYICKKEPYKN